MFEKYNKLFICVNDITGERLLSKNDKPLLERLKIGPSETLGKLFIRERGVRKMSETQEPVVDVADRVIPEAPEEEENLPHEVCFIY